MNRGASERTPFSCPDSCAPPSARRREPPAGRSRPPRLERRHQPHQRLAGARRPLGGERRGCSIRRTSRRPRATPRPSRPERPRTPRSPASARRCRTPGRGGQALARAVAPRALARSASQSQSPPRDRPPSARRGTGPWTACGRRACADRRSSPRAPDRRTRPPRRRARRSWSPRKTARRSRRARSGRPAKPRWRRARWRSGRRPCGCERPRAGDREKPAISSAAVDRARLGRLRQRQRARLGRLDEAARESGPASRQRRGRHLAALARIPTSFAPPVKSSGAPHSSSWICASSWQNTASHGRASAESASAFAPCRSRRGKPRPSSRRPRSSAPPRAR